MSIAVSVVIPTYRRPELLARCLEALRTQDFDPTAYEIIIADDAASESTRAQVSAFAECMSCPCRYVAVRKTHGPAAARNAGWAAARGRFIAFTDDDTVPSQGWLKAGIEALQKGAIAAWGRIIVPLPCRPTDYELDAAGLARAGFVTANCFCRRDALEAIGGFDERFALAWREDTDLFFSLRALSGETAIVQAPAALVVHPIRPAPWGISVRQQRKAMYNALLYKKHPVLYRKIIQAAPPLRYYAIVAALILTVAAALKGAYGWALFGLGTWFGMTLTFCLMRLRETSRDPLHIAEMVTTSVLIPPLAVFWRLRGAYRFRVLFL